MTDWNWTVFAFAALWMAGYALFTPVIAAFAVSSVGWGWGVGYFFTSGAVRRARRRAAGLIKRKRKKKRLSPKTSRRLFSDIRKHARVERIFVSGVLSFENAMHTALVYGAVCALDGMSGRRLYNGVHADFSLGHTEVEITGILSLPAGHMILAVIREGIYQVKERIQAWKSTRLKA